MDIGCGRFRKTKSENAAKHKTIFNSNSDPFHILNGWIWSFWFWLIYWCFDFQLWWLALDCRETIYSLAIALYFQCSFYYLLVWSGHFGTHLTHMKMYSSCFFGAQIPQVNELLTASGVRVHRFAYEISGRRPHDLSSWTVLSQFSGNIIFFINILCKLRSTICWNKFDHVLFAPLLRFRLLMLPIV